MHKARLHTYIQASLRARASAARKGHTWSIERNRCYAKLARTHPTETGMDETLQSKKRCTASSNACADPHASCRNERQCRQGCSFRQRRESRQCSCDHGAGTRHDNFPAPATKTGWGRSTGLVRGKNMFSTPNLPLAWATVTCLGLSCRTLSACLIVSRVTKASCALQCEDCFTNENCTLCVAAIYFVHKVYAFTWLYFS